MPRCLAYLWWLCTSNLHSLLLPHSLTHWYFPKSGTWLNSSLSMEHIVPLRYAWQHGSNSAQLHYLGYLSSQRRLCYGFWHLVEETIFHFLVPEFRILEVVDLSIGNRSDVWLYLHKATILILKTCILPLKARFKIYLASSACWNLNVLMIN